MLTRTPPPLTGDVWPDCCGATGEDTSMGGNGGFWFRREVTEFLPLPFSVHGNLPPAPWSDVLMRGAPLFASGERTPRFALWKRPNRPLLLGLAGGCFKHHTGAAQRRMRESKRPDFIAHGPGRTSCRLPNASLGSPCWPKGTCERLNITHILVQ